MTTLMEEEQYEVRKDDGNLTVKEITKDNDVIEASRREEEQRVLIQNSWLKDVFMLIYFLFYYVTRNLINLHAYEGELVENLFAGQRK